MSFDRSVRSGRFWTRRKESRFFFLGRRQKARRKEKTKCDGIGGWKRRKINKMWRDLANLSVRREISKEANKSHSVVVPISTNGIVNEGWISHFSHGFGVSSGTPTLLVFGHNTKTAEFVPLFQQRNSLSIDKRNKNNQMREAIEAWKKKEIRNCPTSDIRANHSYVSNNGVSLLIQIGQKRNMPPCLAWALHDCVYKKMAAQWKCSTSPTRFVVLACLLLLTSFLRGNLLDGWLNECLALLSTESLLLLSCTSSCYLCWQY